MLYLTRMKKKLMKCVIAAATALVCVGVTPVHAKSDNPCGNIETEADRAACAAYQKELASQNSDLANQLEDIRAQRAEIEANIAKYQKQLEDYQAQLNDLNMQLDGLNKDIAVKEGEIADTSAQADQKQSEIDENESKVEAIGERVKDRMVRSQGSMHFNEWIDILLGASTVRDFLRLAAGITAISNRDQETTDELVELTKDLKKQKKDLQEIQAKLEQEKADLTEQQKAAEEAKSNVAIAQAKVQVIQDAAESQAALLEAKGNTISSTIGSIKDKINASQSELDAYQHRLDEMLQQQQQGGGSNGGGSTGGGNVSISKGWTNPVPGGSRSAGTWNYPGGGIHLGYDFAASEGTPIYAVGSGYIINSTNGCKVGYLGSTCGQEYGGSSGGGNQVYLITPIGNTLYAVKFLHMQFNTPIATGRMVNAGDMIGRVGSTGNVTGPHCHIEVFQIGTASQFSSYINNWNGDLAFGAGWAGSYDGYGRRCANGYGTPCRLRPESVFG